MEDEEVCVTPIGSDWELASLIGVYKALDFMDGNVNVVGYDVVGFLAYLVWNGVIFWLIDVLLRGL
jgi:hypothetical protein